MSPYTPSAVQKKEEKPEEIDIESEVNRTLYCGDLSQDTTEDELFELFLQAGPLDKVIKPPHKNIAFIQYKQSMTLPYAIDLYSDTYLHGRRMRLDFRDGSIHKQSRQRNGAGRPFEPSRNNHPSPSNNNPWQPRRGRFHAPNDSPNRSPSMSSHHVTAYHTSQAYVPQPMHPASAAFNPQQTHVPEPYIPGGSDGQPGVVFAGAQNSNAFSNSGGGSTFQFVSLTNPAPEFMGPAMVNHPDHHGSFEERRDRLNHRYRYATRNEERRQQHRGRWSNNQRR